MDAVLKRLTTAEECERYANNVQRDDPDLAIEARRRAVELRAEAYGATTQAEQEALRAVYAYEEGLSRKRGRKTRASRTWQMIERHGILGAVERAVNRKDVTAGFAVLREMGMEDFAFELVVIRHSQLFSAAALERSKSRVEGWKQGAGT